MKQLITLATAIVFVSSAIIADENTPKSLADHEAAAATMSYKEAIQTQNAMMENGEQYNVIPYTRRAYDLIKKAAAKKTEVSEYLRRYSDPFW